MISLAKTKRLFKPAALDTLVFFKIVGNSSLFENKDGAFRDNGKVKRITLNNTSVMLKDNI